MNLKLYRSFIRFYNNGGTPLYMAEDVVVITKKKLKSSELKVHADDVFPLISFKDLVQLMDTSDISKTEVTFFT